jgi:hypothetical protein
MSGEKNVKRALTIGGLSLAVVLIIGAAAFAGSLGKRIAHDTDHGRNPHVSAARHVKYPRGLALKVRANPPAPVDVLYKLNCHPGRKGEVRDLRQKKTPPIVARVRQKLLKPFHDCNWSVKAFYDSPLLQHGRLVLNLYAKK